MRKQWLVLLIAVVASVTLWGCGSSGSGGSEVTAPAEVIGADDSGNCTICHTFEVHTEINGIAGVNLDADGLGSAITHDCEDCHGGGQYHHGEGPIPYPSPDLERCATCHDQATKVLASVHNGNDAENPSALVPADEHYVDGVCMTCHTAEGFIALKSIVGTETDFDNGFDAATNVPESFDSADNSIVHNPVCGSCHNPLTKEMNTADAGWTPNGSTSAQLALCTSCHGYKLNDGTILATGNTYTVSAAAGTDGEFLTADDTPSAGTDTDVIGHHSTSWYRTIATTHYDNPDSPGVIEGYVIRENGDTPCFDCHGHELRTNTRNHADNDPTDPAAVETIYTEWAASAHAGKLLDYKEAAAEANPVTGSRGSAENTATGHAQVEALLSVGSTDDQFQHHAATSNWSASCQRCHTATGYAAFADNPDTYVDGDGDFSHQAAGQHEMVYCWACHSDSEAGTLRMTEAFTAPYTYASEAVEFPDVGASNACIPCHAGRGIAGEDPGTSGYGATHHYVAAAVLYSNLTHTGAEYPGQDYSKPSYFEHDILGTAADEATGNTDAGPCAVCHMNATAEGQPDHSFEVVEKDDAGVIIGLKSEACVSCHTGAHGAALVTEDSSLGTAAAAAAFLEEESEGYQNAGELLADMLALANGQTNHSGVAIGAADGTIDDHRAFQTSLMPGNDPGGYAHNRYYVKRLLFDAIDWAEDASIDGTIADNSATYAEAMAWFGGTTRP